MMHLPEKRSPRWYPHIAVVYANNDREVENFLNDFAGQGYQQRMQRVLDSLVSRQ